MRLLLRSPLEVGKVDGSCVVVSFFGGESNISKTSVFIVFSVGVSINKDIRR